MTDFEKYSSSVLPEIVLTELVRDLEQLIASSQEKLNIVKTNTNLQQQESKVIVAFLKDVKMLIEFYFIIKNYLDEILVNSQDHIDKGKNVSENSSVEILQVFTHEARHPVSSLQGLTTILESYSASRIQLEILQGFDGVLETMKLMHSRLSDIVELD